MSTRTPTLIGDPEVTREGPDYVVSWPHVVIRASKIKEARDAYGAVLTISVRGLPGTEDGPILKNSHVVLTGSRSKRDTSRFAEERIPDLDWTAYVEACCEVLIERIEEGSPVTDLGEGDIMSEDRPYLLKPLVQEGENVILYGMGGTGKSLLALAAAASMTISSGPGVWHAARRLRVLYLDWEDEEETHRRRLEMLGLGWGLEERPHVLYKRAETSIVNLGEALARQVSRDGIQFLVVDSAALACGAEPEKADSANAFFRVLRSLNLQGSLTIAHQSKADEKMPFGSVFWFNSARSVWHARQSREDERSRTFQMGLFHQKRNDGQREQPFGFNVTFERDYIGFVPHEVTLLDEFAGEFSLPRRIQAAIEAAGKGLSREDILAYCRDVDKRTSGETLRRTLNRMLKSKRLYQANGLFYVVEERYGTG